MSGTTMELTNLLVPLDGSRLAEAVLPACETLARRFGARLTLVHILEQHPPPTVHGERHLADREGAGAYLAEVAERFRGAGIEASTHVHDAPEGDLARSVVEHSQEFRPDVVVLSSHGREGLRGLVSGRIAEQVLRRGECPVLIISPLPDGSAPPFDLGSILLPIDGVHDSTAGIDAARTVALRFGARVHLVLVVPTMGTLVGRERRSGLFMPSAMRAMLELAEEGSRDYLAREAEALRGAGVEVTTEVLRGDTVLAVLGEAERLQPGLIVLCGHGKTGLQALISGSVTHGIAHRAGAPLLLIRTPDEG